MKKYSIFMVIAILMIACKTNDKENVLPFYNTPDFTPVWLKPNDEGYKTIHTIADFSFTNQLGKTITNKNVSGKIYVANFFFTTCASICPRMMSNLAAVQKTYANDANVVILSHSVTPWRDDVATLAKYASDNNINSKNWWLLTGDKETIYKLARQSYFAENSNGFGKGPTDFLHTENLVLIDKHGWIRGVYNGSLRLEVDNLVAHIKLLEKEG
jgi:protein SCO1/2